MSTHRSAHRKHSSSGAGPLVAFTLIAMFGILFAGCTPAIKGPRDVAPEDVTFTEQDIAAMHATLSSDSGQTTSGGEGMAQLEGSASGTTTAVIPSADPALVAAYDALRSNPKAEANGYKVVNSFVNVRSEPASSAAFVQRLEEGVAVNVVEFVNAKWAKVDLGGGKIGYISSQYIAKLTTDDKLAEDKKAFSGLYFVDFAFVNVRKEPNQQSEKVGEIPGQSLLRPLSMDKDWARVSFEGHEGFISSQYLTPFSPSFVVRQAKFALPIFVYSAATPNMVTTLRTQMQTLKDNGAHFTTLRAFRDLLRSQEGRDVRLDPKSVIIAIADVNATTVGPITDALHELSVPATLFVQTKNVGLSAITEKTLITLVANGFDLQSGGHSGNDLRTLTNAQIDLELSQSRKLLEDAMHQDVFAVAYPQGGTNDRVMEHVRAAGYLFGIGASPAPVFSRADFLNLPSYQVTPTMGADELLKLLQ